MWNVTPVLLLVICFSVATIRRTMTILLPNDPDLRATLDAFQAVSQALSPVCFNAGKPLDARRLQKAAYHAVKGALSAQLTGLTRWP